MWLRRPHLADRHHSGAGFYRTKGDHNKGLVNPAINLAVPNQRTSERNEQIADLTFRSEQGRACGTRNQIRRSGGDQLRPVVPDVSDIRTYRAYLDPVQLRRRQGLQRLEWVVATGQP